MKLLDSEVVRFVIIGLLSNIALYAMYLVLTKSGLAPVFSMSILYFLGVFQTFIFNKRWTFKNNSASKNLLWRYIFLYLSGYALNVFILIFFVNRLHYPHCVVQGTTILFLAFIFFIIQKHFIFKSH